MEEIPGQVIVVLHDLSVCLECDRPDDLVIEPSRKLYGFAKILLDPCGKTVLGLKTVQDVSEP